MAKLIIEGGYPLSGTVAIGGAKNAALPIMAASLLASGPVVLKNIPDLHDVHTMVKVLNALGMASRFRAKGELELSSQNSTIREEAPYELVKTMRASFFVMGPLLARLKRARVPLPGGCAIGVRPVNIHLKGFEALGAEVSIDAGYAVASAKKLVGAKILMDFPSVGATENLMMAAALAEGTTIIENAAREPEISDLANFINAMGGRVQGAGSPSISIEGVRELGAVEYSVIPDRIDAGTFMVLGALNKTGIRIQNCVPDHQEVISRKLVEMGTRLEWQGNSVTVTGPARLKPVEIKTLPFPGFPTDMQAQFMVALCLAEGTSLITETVFENRFMHVAELVRMGARLCIRDHTVVVNGVEKISGAPMAATDLRAGAAMVLAGLVAGGTTEVSNVYHIDRGYESLVERLSGLGARVKRVEQNGDK
jgi:UDP-N-acetylglucosamine 1-carboxyvinyltransferase